MKNSELIEYAGSQLGELDKQRRYVLRRLAQKMDCPNCATPSNYFEASGIDIDAADLNTATNDPCACPACKRALRYDVTLTAGVMWSLLPIKLPLAEDR